MTPADERRVRRAADAGQLAADADRLPYAVVLVDAGASSAFRAIRACLVRHGQATFARVEPRLPQPEPPPPPPPGPPDPPLPSTSRCAAAPCDAPGRVWVSCDQGLFLFCAAHATASAAATAARLKKEKRR